MAQGLASQDAGYTQQFRYAFAFALYFLAAPGPEGFPLGTLSPQGTPPKPTTLAKLGGVVSEHVPHTRGSRRCRMPRILQSSIPRPKP